MSLVTVSISEMFLEVIVAALDPRRRVSLEMLSVVIFDGSLAYIYH
jgi:hypothetical protein